MRIRREQGLFLVVVLLAVWIVSRGNESSRPMLVRPTTKEYELLPVPADPLVAPASPEVARRDPFREPSETSPLEPRVLEFPAREPLSVVALPVVPGPRPRHYAALRIPGGVAESFQFGSAGAAAAGQQGAPPAQPPGGAPQGAGDPQLLYDKIQLKGAGKTFWGYVRSPNKYELEGKTTFREPVIYDWVSPKDGRIIRANNKAEAEDIVKIELAKTLRNRIELRRRSLRDGPSSLPRRRAFLDDLLREARSEGWVYKVAAEEAAEYVRIAKGSAAAYRLALRVKHEQGDLAGEWKMIQELPDQLKGSPFDDSVRGQFEARLGLDAAAEQHLRQACDGAPTDPFAQVAYARFLLQHARAHEALDHAIRARRGAAVLESDADRFEVGRVLIRCYLAVGDLAGAGTALTALPIGADFAGVRDQLKAAIEYLDPARRADAMSNFEAAVGAGQAPAALGVAGCQVLNGAWAAAEAGLQAVADSQPLLRHRALAGLGLLYLRTGNVDQALQQLEQAQRVQPDDAYTLYLLGRARRLAGQLQGAVEALKAALAQDDRFIEVYAEMAETYLALADNGGSEAAEALYRARRYADRLVELDGARAGGPEIAYLELQGLVRFLAGEAPAARDVFESARDRSLYCKIGVALVQYSQNQVEPARAQLADLLDSMRSDDPMRGYVENTIRLIDDHAEKEKLVDAFEREQLGDSWEVDSQGGVRPQIVDGSLRIRGQLGSTEGVRAWRVQPLAGRFLSAAVTITLEPGDRSKDALLELTTRTSRSRKGTDFRVRIGFREHQPYLVVEDGDVTRARTPEERKAWDPVDLATLGAIDTAAPHRVELRVLPGDGNRFVLQAVWDGAVVHQRPIERLNATSHAELPVTLVVDGRSRARVDVSFDDFRLDRRKEQ